MDTNRKKQSFKRVDFWKDETDSLASSCLQFCLFILQSVYKGKNEERDNKL